MTDWAGFGIRRRTPMSGRTHVTLVPEIHGRLVQFAEACDASAAEPFVGLTTDGEVRPRPAAALTPRVDTRSVTSAALAFLETLDAEQRHRVLFPLDSSDWRTWINVHMNFYRHGLCLDDLTEDQRNAALAVIDATMSSHTASDIRDIFAINGLIAELADDDDAFGEWLYNVSIFGSPSYDEPWGWQIDGHHVDINCMVLPDGIVVTPTFLGSEPRHVTLGGRRIALFDDEEKAGLTLIDSLDEGQRAEAVLYDSIMPGRIPAHLEHWINGRMEAGAFSDNAVMPYQGIRVRDLDDRQRDSVLELASVYMSWNRADHAHHRMEEVADSLDDTWFSWYGGTGPRDVFYYRLHSPAVWIEFDHHPGIVFDNDKPTRNHVHTIVRTPNGGDYGTDALAHHYAQTPHALTAPRPGARHVH